MHQTPIRRRALPALLGMAAGGLDRAARAQGARGDVLNIGLATTPGSADPHFYNFQPNNNLALHVFSRLVERDARIRPIPGLALSWTPVGDTAWEFKLRPGVKWHDGRGFTADDVAFTLDRIPKVPNSPGSFAGFVRPITRVEVVDPLTIRLHTAGPHPVLPNDLTFVSIVSRHAGEGATTEDYNSGKAAIGTGPYRLVRFQPGSLVELARNDAYFGGAEPWSRVNLRVIPQAGPRAAALLSGDVDLIDAVSANDVQTLRRDPRVTVAETQSTRLIFLQMNFSTDGPLPDVTDNEGRPLPRNPFKDLRVRRALSLGLDREALVSRVMEGRGTPYGQWLPAGFYSNNPEIGVPPFDAEAGRRLLAEAGYPQGFRVTIHTPNDRFANDSRIAQAAAAMWTRMGVATTVDAQPYSAFSARASKAEYGVWLHSWASSTGEASYFLSNVVATVDAAKRMGVNNWSRYSDPRLDALTEKSFTLLDPAEREAVLRQAVKHVSDEVVIIPLFHLALAWGVRQGLRFEANMSDYTDAMDIRRD
ncbi:ABC transporter substrate-binding protein [Roseomonas indoligenes]|uniref:ABC transporter substrate-binding protein n=1 Tax=Roseomonas indoligenes TaxID=2820811 RepID=A0A940N0U6_9PROT|nr:ABC transporter substrate-binding protein [Pararoseomonas indoligenes]MBP0494702.1 ABC transporter substrate-binding protein [Pararoseomonas indoligenes]